MVRSPPVVTTPFHEVVIGTGGRNMQVGVKRSLEGMSCNWQKWALMLPAKIQAIFSSSVAISPMIAAVDVKKPAISQAFLSN